jgi:hypothetical protein
MAGYNVREYRFTLSYIAQPIVCGGGELPVCSMVASLSHSLRAPHKWKSLARSFGRGINTPINKCTHAARIMLSARRSVVPMNMPQNCLSQSCVDYLLNYSAGCIDFPARTPCQIPPPERERAVFCARGALRSAIPSGALSID